VPATIDVTDHLVDSALTMKWRQNIAHKCGVFWPTIDLYEDAEHTFFYQSTDTTDPYTINTKCPFGWTYLVAFDRCIWSTTVCPFGSGDPRAYEDVFQNIVDYGLINLVTLCADKLERSDIFREQVSYLNRHLDYESPIVTLGSGENLLDCETLICLVLTPGNTALDTDIRLYMPPYLSYESVMIESMVHSFSAKSTLYIQTGSIPQSENFGQPEYHYPCPYGWDLNESSGYCEVVQVDTVGQYVKHTTANSVGPQTDLDNLIVHIGDAHGKYLYRVGKVGGLSDSNYHWGNKSQATPFHFIHAGGDQFNIEEYDPSRAEFGSYFLYSQRSDNAANSLHERPGVCGANNLCRWRFNHPVQESETKFHGYVTSASTLDPFFTSVYPLYFDSPSTSVDFTWQDFYDYDDRLSAGHIHHSLFPPFHSGHQSNKRSQHQELYRLGN
jgi:hypothetical protein